MINWKKSAELNNMSINELKIYFKKYPKSHKKIIAICDTPDCEYERCVSYHAYRNLCKSCANKKRFEKPEEIEKSRKSFLGRKHTEKTIKLMSDIKTKQYKDMEERILQSCRLQKISRKKWSGFGPKDKYCNLFNLSLKEAIRLYFNNVCFMDGEPEENGYSLCVHHVNYDKRCGCNATQFCIFVPVKAKWNIKFNGNKENNRWYWYSFLMRKIFMEHPNYFAYHIPVWGMNELEYNYDYVFEKFRSK